jgi:hypothetical protein
MKTMKVKWTGIRPLIMHNGLLADPTNPVVVEQKKITAKKNKKTDADCFELARLEFLGGLYLGVDGRLIIPSDNIERTIQDGARKSRLGKDVQAAVFCSDSEIAIHHPLIDGKSPDQLWADKQGRFVLRKGVKVTTSRVIRVRPMIPTGWVLSFDLEYDESIINPRNLEQAMIDAGALCGLGDWRPKFGRFTVEIG